jgi:hypothetical protein
MKHPSKKGKTLSRRSILPILGSSLLVPLFGFGNSNEEPLSSPNDEEYQTLLKPDGTAVKVKISTLNKSKVIEKNLSNKSFLNWLGKKL